MNTKEKLRIFITFAFSASVVSQFMSSPWTTHWERETILHILMYLYGAPCYGVFWDRNHGHTTMEGFSMTDWDGSLVDGRSTYSQCPCWG